MDYTFNKTVLVMILSLSSLLLSSNAIPSTQVNDFISTSVSATAPKSSFIDNTSPSFPVYPPTDYSYPDAPSLDPEFCKSCDICNTPKIVANVDPEILKICEGGEYEIKDCTKTLWKLLEGPFDAFKALEIEIKDTHDVIEGILFLLNSHCGPSSIDTDKRVNDAFCICRDQYDAMLKSINQTLEILPQKKFVDAYKNMEAMLSYEKTCHIAWTLSAPGFLRPWGPQPIRERIFISVNILSNILNKHSVYVFED